MKARTTAERIHEHYTKRPVRRSNGIGISTLGEECERKLWYEFRWVAPAERHDGRMNRLFNTGEREEARLVEDMRAIGYLVEDRDPETGGQFRVEAFGGHISGYLDGIVTGTAEDPSRPYGFEAKTHNQKNFDKLQAKGVEKSHPKHFAQCQAGALLGELPGTLYVAQCKDDDSLYSELVPLNAKKAQALVDKGERIVFSKEPPAKLKDSAEYPPCSWCRHQRLCHYSTAHKPLIPEANCRTCSHATPERDGTWSCERHGWVLDKERQEKGCETHLFRPDLLPFGEPIETGDDWQLFAGMMVNTAGGKVFKDDE